MNLFIENYKFPFINNTLYKKYTYKNLLIRSIYLSQQLQKYNTIALFLPNSTQYIELVFASILSNTNIVHLSHTNFIHFIDNSHIDVFYIDVTFWRKLSVFFREKYAIFLEKKIILININKSIHTTNISNISNTQLYQTYKNFLEKSLSFQLFPIKYKQNKYYYLSCSTQCIQYLSANSSILNTRIQDFFHNLKGLLQVFQIIENGKKIEKMYINDTPINYDLLAIKEHTHLPIFSNVTHISKNIYNIKLYNTLIKIVIIKGKICVQQSNDLFFCDTLNKLEYISTLRELPINNFLEKILEKKENTFVYFKKNKIPPLLLPSPNISPKIFFFRENIFNIKLIELYNNIYKWSNTFNTLSISFIFSKSISLNYNVSSPITIILNIYDNSVLFLYKSGYSHYHKIIYKLFLENMFFSIFSKCPNIIQRNNTIKSIQNTSLKQIFPLKLNELFTLLLICIIYVYIKILNSLKNIKNKPDYTKYISKLPIQTKHICILEKSQLISFLKKLEKHEYNIKDYILEKIREELYKHNKNKQITIYTKNKTYNYYDTLLKSSCKTSKTSLIKKYFREKLEKPNINSTQQLYINFSKSSPILFTTHFLGSIHFSIENNSIIASVYGRYINNNILVVDSLINHLKEHFILCD